VTNRTIGSVPARGNIFALPQYKSGHPPKQLAIFFSQLIHHSRQFNVSHPTS
jgi:hypothetical protein